MNELALQIKEIEVDKSTSEELQLTFTPFFEQAKEWKAKAEAITVTDVSQQEEIKEAKKARLALRQIRIDVEKKRKELKEDSLRKSRAIDGIANVVKYLIAPIEKHLEDQEKFVERQEQERKEKVRTERMEILNAYDFDAELYPLAEMSEPAFEQLKSVAKAAFDKIQEEARLEAERLDQERKQKELRSNRREYLITNDLLRFWEPKENEDLGQMSNQDFKALKTNLAAKLNQWEEDQEQIKAENERLKAEAEAKAAEERKRKEEEEKRLAAERKKREDLEAKIKAEAEAKAAEERKRKEEEERKLKAPDKEKLRELATNIDQLECNGLKSEKAIAAYRAIKKKLIDLSSEVRQQSELL